jgi:rare lipoprotein A
MLKPFSIAIASILFTISTGERWAKAHALLAVGELTTQVTLASVIGKASWYGGWFNGRRTANGEIYNQNGLTAASNQYKFGTKLKVTNISNGRSVIVRVNDRGGFEPLGRIIDLSRGAADAIGMRSAGVTQVKIEMVK